MNAGANFGATAATNAAIAAAIQSSGASGVIVEIEPDDFCSLVDQNDEPVVVHAMGGLFTKTHRYLTSYRGLAFSTKSRGELPLPRHCQLVEAKSIWIPG